MTILSRVKHAAVALILALPAAPALAEVPKVVLSEQHAKMCLVGVGDAMPAVSLTGADGEVALRSQYGKTATVVAVLGPKHWMNPALLSDLPADVLKPYANQGVAAVVFKTRDSPAKLPKGSPLTLLSDPAGKAFAQLGSGRQPRVYVLDAKGAIVWFDIEYSRSTRRELKQTLASVVGE